MCATQCELAELVAAEHAAARAEKRGLVLDELVKLGYYGALVQGLTPLDVKLLDGVTAVAR